MAAGEILQPFGICDGIVSLFYRVCQQIEKLFITRHSFL